MDKLSRKIESFERQAAIFAERANRLERLREGLSRYGVGRFQSDMAQSAADLTPDVGLKPVLAGWIREILERELS